MDTIGRHVLADFEGCDPKMLADPKKMLGLLRKAARAAKATVVEETVTRSSVGVSVLLVISESHLCIHTRADEGLAIADFYTCGECQPEKACDVLAKGLSPQRYQKVLYTRGLLNCSPSMQMTKPPEIWYREEQEVCPVLSVGQA